MDSSSLFVLQYNINTSGALSALVMCTAPGDHETYVIECGVNGQWNTDITVVCRSSNPQTIISEYNSCLLKLIQIQILYIQQ